MLLSSVLLTKLICSPINIYILTGIKNKASATSKAQLRKSVICIELLLYF